MASLQELQKERKKKLQILKEEGVDPYPAESKRDTTIANLLADFNEDGKRVTIAGRLMAIRKHGGSIFVDIYDGTGTIQGYFKKDEIDTKIFELFAETADIGDFIDLTGTLTTTKRGEETVLAADWRMLTKSLRPLPEKWAGLQDEEERLRRRYLDILFNKETRELIQKKSVFWQAVRQFMLKKGFMEVETPVLENTTGGADARPFETHHNALDLDVYLRISAGELWQKRLMVAGLPKVFEIGRIFRNEGISAEHLQDYTQMEFYWAYADYEMGMELTTELFRYVAQETFGTQQFSINEHEIDLTDEWERYDYTTVMQEKTGIDPLDTTLDKVNRKLAELGIEHEKGEDNLPRAIDALWKYCRKQLSGPGFLVGVPKELSPLAKSDPKNPRITERFQTIIAGTELSNGYSELNDPQEQKERFKKQQAMREAGDEEAQMMDEDFVEALEYGMPPTCGFGMSERVFSFFAGVPIRQQVTFPLLKPQNDQ